MNLEDLLLTSDAITAKYPLGSPDYPSHGSKEHPRCGCSGCHASWEGWRAAVPLREHVAGLDIALAAEKAENARLSDWVSDLQAGGYVNCVYCGHRYGPDPGTPVAMADVLKAHVSTCPEHPMAKLTAAVVRHALIRAPIWCGKHLECPLCDISVAALAEAGR